jgi:cytochrome c-type biogenesis protein CcsB
MLNNWHILERLAPVMFIFGLLLLALTLIPVFREKLDFRLFLRILFILICIAFALQTMAFVLRWIAAEHAPWSNKYESMIYIAWATLLAGLLFSRQSTLALGASALWNGIILLAAHMQWMDPAVTNLPPVLKSYWLVIHVSVITSSYGFLGLAAMVSGILLVLFIFIKDQKNASRLEPLIQRNTWLNERVLMIGLALVVIGNIFGAIWANESWGRYWGWDPKETWTLIMILVYTAVLHLRLIPKLRGVYLFHVVTLLAFSTVMMTYFGVNFYLSGLHSYAAGDPVPIPWFVYADIVAIGVIIVLGVKHHRLSFEEESQEGA